MDDFEHYSFEYVFQTSDDKVFTYKLTLDESTLNLINDDPDRTHPEWMKLDENKCEGCPLNAATQPYCPMAVGIGNIVENFAEDLSYKEMTVTVKTEDRNYFKKTTLQNGLYSILGIVMATSGCPKLSPLKAMARFHLPFSSTEETLVRVLSFYLVSQYFKSKKQEIDTFDLTQLHVLYQEIDTVNKGMLQRIRAISKKDANQNGIVILDAFVSMLNSAIGEDFEGISHFFKSS